MSLEEEAGVRGMENHLCSQMRSSRVDLLQLREAEGTDSLPASLQMGLVSERRPRGGWVQRRQWVPWTRAMQTWAPIPRAR